MNTSEQLQNSFQNFASLLNERFAKGVLTTEDSVRYTFFHSIFSQFDVHPHDIILENPHPMIERAEIDMLIPAKKDRNELVFEFKFDREMPSGHNSPRPMKAGKLFADLFRLAKYKEKSFQSRCFFVYVTDFEMANYLSNDTNRLDDFFNLLPDMILNVDSSYIDNHSETFVAQASVYGKKSFKLFSSLTKDLQNDFFVRIYEINRNNG